MLASLALKNLRRSKGRSIVIALLGIAATWLFILYVAFMNGSHAQLIRDGVELYTGYMHVDVKGYRDYENYDYLIEDLAALEAQIERSGAVGKTAPRFETFALLSVKQTTVGAMVAGIDPEAEAGLSRLKASLQRGEYLSAGDTNALYIGSELARRLEADVGDEVALIGSDVYYSTAADLFTVKGIFKTGQFEFDASSAFANKTYLDEVMSAQNMASYVVLAPKEPGELDAALVALRAQLDERYEAVGWPVLLKALLEALTLDSVFGYISIGIFFVVIFFVVMIFGYVNIGTRMREIGILRALGLRRGDVFRLLFYEALILAAVSLALGMAAGVANVWYLQAYPLRIEGLAEMYKEYDLVVGSDIIPIGFSWWTVTWNALLIFALNLLSVLYPIAQANRLEPVEAMHHV